MAVVVRILYHPTYNSCYTATAAWQVVDALDTNRLAVGACADRYRLPPKHVG